MDLITVGHEKGFEPSLEPEDLGRKVDRWQYLFTQSSTIKMLVVNSQQKAGEKKIINTRKTIHIYSDEENQSRGK